MNFRWLNCAALLVAAAGAALSVQAQSAAPYRILDRIALPDAGGWDYLTVDPPAHRLYITRGDHVDVLDTASGELAGVLSGLHAIHGVALDPAGGLGYISDGGANAVAVFDRATLKITATVPAGADPDSIVFEPATRTVWAFNGHSNNVTVIDAASARVLATLALPGRPEAPAIDGTGLIYDAIEDKNEIARLDAHAMKLTAAWPVACDRPSALTLDPAGHRLFAACDGNKAAVLDAVSGKALGAAAIGSGPDAAAFSPQANLAFVSCGEGVLSVIDAAAPGFPTVQTLKTEPGARTMAYNPQSGHVYLVTASFGPRPAPTAQNPRPRAPMIPGTFIVLVLGR